MMHKSDDPTPRDCDEYIAPLVAFDGDSQAALFAHCTSLSVNAVHEPWNLSPRRLAAAVQVPAPSLMLDDGTVERRVRLLRPMERPAISLGDLTHTHWREAERADFIRAWKAEIAAVPEFTDSNIRVVTGLLLPIWKRLPNDSMRVYRLETDDGERVIGRLVSPALIAQAAQSDAPTLSPPDAFAAVLDGRTVLQLQHGLELRRVRVMGESRVELSGFTDAMVDRLKAMGLISEIISWKLRLLVPTGSSGPTILAKLMEGHPPVRVADKAAA